MDPTSNDTNVFLMGLTALQPSTFVTNEKRAGDLSPALVTRKSKIENRKSIHRLPAIQHLRPFVVLEVFLGQRLHDLAALVIEPLQLARLVLRQGVVREDGHGD